MDIKLRVDYIDKLHKIAERTETTTEDLLVEFIQKGIEEYCQEDKTFAPKKAKLYSRDKDGVRHYYGEGYLLREITVYNYPAYKVYIPAKKELSIVYADNVDIL